MRYTIQGFLLVLLMLLACPAVTVSASEIYTEGYFFYRVEENSVTICGYFGNESEVTVPARIAGNPVSTVGKGAFSEHAVIHKVNLPDTIMIVEEGAFGPGIEVVYDSNRHRTAPGSDGESKDPDPGQVMSPGQDANGNDGTGSTANDVGADGAALLSEGVDEADTELDEKAADTVRENKSDPEEMKRIDSKEQKDLETSGESGCFQEKDATQVDWKRTALLMSIAVIVIAAAIGFGFCQKRKRKGGKR